MSGIPMIKFPTDFTELKVTDMIDEYFSFRCNVINEYTLRQMCYTACRTQKEFDVSLLFEFFAINLLYDEINPKTLEKEEIRIPFYTMPTRLWELIFDALISKCIPYTRINSPYQLCIFIDPAEFDPLEFDCFYYAILSKGYEAQHNGFEAWFEVFI